MQKNNILETILIKGEYLVSKTDFPLDKLSIQTLAISWNELGVQVQNNKQNLQTYVEYTYL